VPQRRTQTLDRKRVKATGKRWMISLWPGCHAEVHRTRVGRTIMAPLLLDCGASSTRTAMSSQPSISECSHRQPFRFR
jgi:hypothetical protein